MSFEILSLIKPDDVNFVDYQNIISTTDRKTYGRCYIVIPTPEMISYGIKWIKVFGKVKLGIYVLTPGMLESTRKTNKKNLKGMGCLRTREDHLWPSMGSRNTGIYRGFRVPAYQIL